VSIQLHHLAHAVQFAFGVLLGAALASSSEIYRRFSSPRWSDAALAMVIVAPAAMLLLMVPDLYEPLEDDDALHGAYHLLVAAIGLLTGFASSLLGRIPGRLLLVLAVGMALMYAGGVTGG
jgi:hypothetical protein